MGWETQGAPHQFTQISVTKAIKNIKHGPRHLTLLSLTSWIGLPD